MFFSFLPGTHPSDDSDQWLSSKNVIAEISADLIFSISRNPSSPLLLVYRALKHGKSLPLPPGPPKLPVIGNMHLVSGPALHRSFWELAKKYGPLMHLKLGSVSTIIISSAEVAEEVMKNKDRIFANRPKLAAPEILGYNYTDVAFAQYGTYWKVLRKICVQELLNEKRINSFRSVREEEVALLVQSIASSSMEPH